MYANPRSKPRYILPKDGNCKGWQCRKCVFKHLRPCLLGTFVKIDETVVYENHLSNIYKVFTRNFVSSTKYNNKPGTI